MSPPAPSSDAEARWTASMSDGGERSRYKDVWNRQARELETAKLAVAGYTDEAAFERAAGETLGVLTQAVGLQPHEIWLEIGCGVGRMAPALSPRCLHWVGTDISGEMIRHASARLRGLPNVTLIELADVGLREIPDDTIDVVYCTVVLMHLQEWDRFRYVQEALRVLRPGGRCYFDNMDLSTDEGWRLFEAGARYPADRRPAHLSMTSTAPELETYARRAGFTNIRLHRPPGGWVAVTGVKPPLKPGHAALPAGPAPA